MEVFFVAEYMMKFRSVSPHCPTSLAPIHIFHMFQPCWISFIRLKLPFPSNFETISHVVTKHFSLLFIVLVRVFQKNKANRVCVWREKERDIYYKELAHVTFKAREVPRASVGSHPGEPTCGSHPHLKGWEPGQPMVEGPLRRPMGLKPKKRQCFSSGPKAGKDWCLCSRQSGKRSKRSSLLFSLFVVFRSLADWMNPAHIRQGNQLNSVYWLKCSSHPEHPHGQIQNNVWPNAQMPCGPSKTMLGAPTGALTASCPFPTLTFWYGAFICLFSWLDGTPTSLHVT